MSRFSSAQRTRRRARMEASQSRGIGPWKVLRIVLRIVLSTFLAWLVLALLWAFLPSHTDANSDGHAASVLRSGGGLTRVYPSSTWHLVQGDRRQGFAIDYTIHDSSSSSPTLTIAGSNVSMPLFYPTLSPEIDEASQTLQAISRTGDTDGANLPWFTFADSVLLFNYIHLESIYMNLTAKWSIVYVPGKPEIIDRQKMEILLTGATSPWAKDPLLRIEMDSKGGKDGIEIVSVEFGKDSDSPTWTYPLRVAIIRILAPTSIFFNNLLGPMFSSIGHIFSNGLLIFLVVLMYGFLLGAIIISLWRCFGGASLETTIGRVQGRLDIWRESGRFSWMRVDVMQDTLDSIQESERFQSVLRFCREGWHPERDRERMERRLAVQRTADLEKGIRGVKIRIRR